MDQCRCMYYIVHCVKVHVYDCMPGDHHARELMSRKGFNFPFYVNVNSKSPFDG